MTGSVKANLVYDLIANISIISIPADALIQIWKFCIPQKIICFNWLGLSNRVHTWDNLIKKGWIGPHWCCLCRAALEYVDHLFTECCFTRQVLSFISISLSVPIIWKEPSYLLNVVSWFRKENNLTYLPPLMAWKIWLARNKCIFEDKKADIHYIVHSLLEQLQLYPAHS